MFRLCIYLPGFIIIILFISNSITEFLIKDLWYEGTLKYLGESVTGTETGSEMKQQHSKLSV